MPTPDYPDFTQPVATIEQVTQLITHANVPAGGYVSPQLSTLGANELLVFLTDISSAPVGNWFTIEVAWQDGALSSGVNFYTARMSTAADPNACVTAVRIPVSGQLVTIAVSPTNAGVQASVDVRASTRVPAVPNVQGNEAFFGGLLVNYGPVALAANTSLTFDVGPVARAVNLYGASTAATVSFTLNGYINNATGPFLVPLAAIFPGGTSQTLNDFYCPGMALQLIINNPTAAASTTRCALVDVS